MRANGCNLRLATCKRRPANDHSLSQSADACPAAAARANSRHDDDALNGFRANSQNRLAGLPTRLQASLACLRVYGFAGLIFGARGVTVLSRVRLESVACAKVSKCSRRSRERCSLSRRGCCKFGAQAASTKQMAHSRSLLLCRISREAQCEFRATSANKLKREITAGRQAGMQACA